LIDKIFNLGFRGLLNYSPVESVTLLDALSGKLSYKLSSGDLAELNKEQIDKLSKILPPYMWGLVRLPIVVLKTQEPGVYIVSGGDWEKKAIDLILNSEKNGILNTSDLERLLKEFDSIIFITLSVSLINFEEYKEEEW